jgi:hypothetical protein
MEKIVYRSKVSKGIAAFIAVLIIATLLTLVFSKAWVGLITGLCIFIVFAYIFNTTYYTIAGNTLKVHSGFIVNISIDIATITKIEPTNTVLSAPALSFDRLEIFYNKYDSVVISPGDKAAFIERLKAINPGIVSVD